MLVTAFAAIVFFGALQSLLVVHLADKLTPGAVDDRSSTQRPAGGQVQYA